MSIVAGVNLSILDNSAESSTGVVTLKNSVPISVEGGMLVINYGYTAGKTDTGFTIKLKSKFNNSTINTNEYYYTETSAGVVSQYSRTVSVAMAGKFFIPIPFPAPQNYLVVEITWGGTLTDLSTLTIGLLANRYNA